MKFCRQFTIADAVMQPAARMLHAVSCTSALLSCSRHDAQRSIAKGHDSIGIKPLSAKL
jgi:hypothetical protein